MPRNVRNFWITVEVDGKEQTISAGPRRADGGLSVRFYIRHKGGVMPALDVDGLARSDGSLQLTATSRNEAWHLLAGRYDDGARSIELNAER